MVDLTSHYGGIALRNPIIAGSSGLTASLQQLTAIAQAGAGAIILKSLFEEQIEATALQAQAETDAYYPEGLDYMLHYTRQHEVEKYLDLIREAKSAVDIPVIASINCYRGGEWETFAKSIQEAGADALELNVMRIETNPAQRGIDLEQELIDLAISITRTVHIPVVFKISDRFTNILSLAQELAKSGVKGLTCFNKSWQTDINIDSLEIVQGPVISTGHELYNTLKYTGLLSGKLPQLPISASGGVMDYAGIVKCLLVGASSVQVASALYQHGVPYLTKMLEELTQWMTQHGYRAIDEFRAMLDASKQADQELYMRSQFMRYFSSKA